MKQRHISNFLLAAWALTVAPPASGNISIGDGKDDYWQNHRRFISTSHLRHSSEAKDRRSLLGADVFSFRTSSRGRNRCGRICRSKEGEEKKRCVFLCRCFRRSDFSRCTEKESKKKQNRCKRRKCKAKWARQEKTREEEIEEEENANTDAGAGDAEMIVIGRSVRSGATYSSSGGGPFTATMRAFDPGAVPEMYRNCTNLYEDVRAATAMLVNKMIHNFANQENWIIREKETILLDTELPPVAMEMEDGEGADQEEVIDEDSFGTNNQVEGIEEAEILQSDGTHVYAAYGDTLITWKAESGVILSRTTIPPNTKTEKGDYCCGGLNVRINGLLLHNDRLIVIASGYAPYRYLPEDVPILSEVGNLQILAYDVDNIPTDGESPLTLLGTKYLRGRYVAARSIGKIAHIVHMSTINAHHYFYEPLSRYGRAYEGTNDTEYVEKAAEVALGLIDSFAAKLVDEIASEAGSDCSNVAEITVYSSGDEAGGNETNSTNSSRPEELFGEEGILRAYLEITSFDMEGGVDPEGGNLTMATASLFYNGTDAVVYASEDYLIAAARGWWRSPFNFAWDQTTFLTSFKLQGDGSPAKPWGAGIVPGNVKDSYSMDECDGYIRIATTSRARFMPICIDEQDEDMIMPFWWCPWQMVSNSTSQLVVLRLPSSENDTSGMVEVGRVENLGVTEEIKSTRFIGCDKAFIVTFRLTDPLYAINLTNPHSPFVAGELKITVRSKLVASAECISFMNHSLLTYLVALSASCLIALQGFSSYMHEYPKDDESDDRLLMIGVGREADPKTGRESGSLVSLFDLTNMSNPQLLQKHVVDSGRSAAAMDPYGFRFLDQSKLLLLPMYVYKSSGGPFDESSDGPFDGFFAMRVTTEAIDVLFNVSMADSSRISSWCWYNARMPPRSLVFKGNATFIKAHSYKSVELTASVNQGVEVTRWSYVLDPPNMTEDECCNYWCFGSIFGR